MKKLRFNLILGSAFLALSPLGCGEKDDSSPPPVQQNGEDVTEKTELIVAVYGDSISTGVLASTNLGKQPSNETFKDFVSAISSEGFQLTKLQSEFSEPELAAATSLGDYGIPSYIASKESVAPEKVVVLSAARFGGRLEDIETMKEQIVAKLNGVETDYVVFMLGGNDFCAELTPEEFATEYKKKLDILNQAHPKAKFLVGYVPPVYQLPNYEYDYGPEIVEGLEIDLVSCKEFRENTCSRLYTPEAEATVKAFNESISKIVKETLGARGILAEDLRQWQIKKEELSFDCFHPSEAGQRIIGESFRSAF